MIFSERLPVLENRLAQVGAGPVNGAGSVNLVHMNAISKIYKLSPQWKLLVESARL
jgi:hypothetical protein